MDTRIVEINKNIIITQSLVSINLDVLNFNKDINIQFIPDYVIVKEVSYNVGLLAAETDVSLVNSSLINNETLCTFAPNIISNPGSMFVLKKPISGNFSFTITGVTGQLTRNGSLAISLDFVKYKELKEGKIY